jgi:tetratricopeptide (TPR) repeat protein
MRWCTFLRGEVDSLWGYVQRLAGNLPGAASAYRRAIAEYRQYPDLPDEFRAEALNNLAFVEAEQGEINDARRHAEAALVVRRRYGSDYNLALSYNTRARNEICAGQLHRALDYVRQAHALLERIQAVRGLSLCLPVLGEAHRKVAEKLDHRPAE